MKWLKHNIKKSNGTYWYKVLLVVLAIIFLLVNLFDGRGNLRNITDMPAIGWAEIISPVFILALVTLSKWFSDRIYYLFIIQIYLIQLDISYFAASHGFDIYSQIGLVFGIFLFTNFFKTFRQFIVYAVYAWVLMILALVFTQSLPPDISPELMFINLTGVAAFNFVLGWRKFRLEKERDKNKKLFQVIFENSTNSLFIFDAKSFEQLSMNKKAVRNFGRLFVSQTETKNMVKLVNKVKEIAIGGVSEIQFESDKGAWWGDVVVIPIKIASEDLLFVLVHDISVYKENESQLQAQRSELMKINNLMVGRELKMIELKREIEDLKKKLDAGSFRNS